MALIKEDGSIVAGANSYADEADADAFQADRGRADWTDADTDAKEAALVRATDYIEGRFALSFAGCRIDDVQTLSWPRTGAHYPATGNNFPIDEVPVDVVNATSIYAEAINADGSLEGLTELAVTPDIPDDGRTVTRLKQKVDVLETDTTFASSDSGYVPIRLIRPIPEADRLIRRWLQGGRATLGLTARI